MLLKEKHTQHWKRKAGIIISQKNEGCVDLGKKSQRIFDSSYKVLKNMYKKEILKNNVA